jgi:hypothetical protein
MEKPHLSGAEQKIEEYLDRINTGESKDSILQGLPPSFASRIEAGIAESEKKLEDQKKIEDLRGRLETHSGPPIKNVEVVIDDEFMQKNLLPGNKLRMTFGHANWNGEVELIQYVISEKLSPEYLELVRDKVEKNKAGQEKTYHHESHHIRNRENNLTPHLASENLREFLTFRVLDELTAFTTGELYNQELTPEQILIAIEKAKQDIENSYYGEPFERDAKWYKSQHANKPELFSRKIDTEKYHKVMRQYFMIKGKDVLGV